MRASSLGYVVGNGDAQPSSHTSDSLIRHQFQQGYGPGGGHEYVNGSFDPEIRELYQRSRQQEEEILQLRKQLNDASLNELQLLNEKHVLERTFCELKLALDEKQDDAISGTLKELSHKKSCLEENSRLAHALKMEEEEIYIYTSSLLSLLAEHNIRPPVLNASMITNGTQRLYHHMHWKLRSNDMTYRKLHPDTNNNQIDLHINDTSNPSRGVQGYDRIDVKDVNAPHPGMIYPYMKDLGGTVASNVHEGYAGEVSSANVGSEIYTTSKHHIPASNFQDDNLPGIEGFQIVGDAKPGYNLMACGVPINGTTLCIFQWVREFENGITQVIEGATVPDYVVTADDVDTYLAVDCTPMDDHGNQGGLVRQFANNQCKISCDSDMQGEIDNYTSAGKATFNVLVLSDSSDDWEEADLILNRSSYQIKVRHTESVSIDEKYSAELYIKVPYGYSYQFVLVCSNGMSLPFSTDASSSPELAIRLRDIIVLTMRCFQRKAVDGKGKAKYR